MAATKKAATAEKMSDIYIEGAVSKALFGATRWDKEDKFRVTIKSDDIPYDEIKAYDNTKSSFIPDWYKAASMISLAGTVMKSSCFPSG